MTAARRVHLREVGPRDGLQAEAPIPVDARVELVDALAATGLTEIEAGSFVSPKAVPSMAATADVFARIDRRPGVAYVALVPNRRGAELAVDAGADGLTVTVSASAAYSEKNVHMSIEESVAAAGEIRAVAGDLPIDAVISCAFGSPYEGDIAPAAVHAIAERLRALGADRITLADTTGMATPPRIAAVLALTGTDVGLHLHETRGTALVNAYAAVQAGVTRFDTALGGTGGSPFAAGAAGNLATEDLVYLLDELGVATGVDLDRLLDVAATLPSLLGHSVPSRVAAAGPRLRPAPA